MGYKAVSAMPDEDSTHSTWFYWASEIMTAELNITASGSRIFNQQQTYDEFFSGTTEQNVKFLKVLEKGSEGQSAAFTAEIGKLNKIMSEKLDNLFWAQLKHLGQYIFYWLAGVLFIVSCGFSARWVVRGFNQTSAQS